MVTGMSTMRILIAIPALNEAPTVGAVIQGIPRSFPGFRPPVVLVVDDGSTDGTAEAAASAGAIVLRHGRNLGLGETFRTALRYARKNGFHVMATMDADGQFDPSCLPLLVEPAASGRADLVTASRFLDPALTPDMPRIKAWGNRRVARLVSRLSGLDIKDATCGFRAYGPAALEKLSSFSRFTYTQEVIIDLAAKGLRIEEIPVKVLGRRPVGKSRIADNLWRYTILSLAAMYSAAHDYRPWRFYGTPAVALLMLGLVGDGFVFTRWLLTHRVTPFAGVAIAGLFLITFSALLFLFASLADTASHQRHLVEELISRDVVRDRIAVDLEEDPELKN
jgi:glycosyltransferase involved in cell wall biosynthesis